MWYLISFEKKSYSISKKQIYWNMINIGREIQVLWSFFLPFSFAIKFSVELLLLSDRFERAYGKKKKRRRKRRWIDSLFQRLSRFQIKWNRCSHSLVFITPCLYVYVWARASKREGERERKEARSWENARLHAWRINTEQEE